MKICDRCKITHAVQTIEINGWNNTDLCDSCLKALWVWIDKGVD